MPTKIDNHILSLIITERDQILLDSFLPTDWDLVAGKAQAEGVAPLVYWTLSKSGKLSTLPESARNSLRSMYSNVWRYNQDIFKELEILAGLFDQAHIPTVVLKGACFALTIYPDIGLRQMGDLDLLVPKENLTEAVRMAELLGFEQTIPEATPGLNDLLSHHVFLQKIGVQPVALEIHYSLVADKSFEYAVPVDWFWGQTELLESTILKRSANLLMLTPTAQILYACTHAMLQHGGKNTPLRWYFDLDQLVRFYGKRIDWDLLLSQARSFEWGSALNAALSQTYIYFNTPLPDHVRVSLAELTDRHRSLIELLQYKPATHILEERQKLLSLNWVGRFRLTMALLVPDPQYMRWRYKLKTSWVLPAYYIFRWWGIFKDALHTIAVLFQKT